MRCCETPSIRFRAGYDETVRALENASRCQSGASGCDEERRLQSSHRPAKGSDLAAPVVAEGTGLLRNALGDVVIKKTAEVRFPDLFFTGSHTAVHFNHVNRATAQRVARPEKLPYETPPVIPIIDHVNNQGSVGEEMRHSARGAFVVYLLVPLAHGLHPLRGSHRQLRMPGKVPAWLFAFEQLKQTKAVDLSAEQVDEKLAAAASPDKVVDLMDQVIR